LPLCLVCALSVPRHLRKRAACVSRERERGGGEGGGGGSRISRGGKRHALRSLALYKLLQFSHCYKLLQFSHWSTAGAGRSVFKWTDAPVEVEFADGSARDGKLDPVKRFIAQNSGG